MNIIILLLLLLIPIQAHADDYGCFEPNAAVQARLSVLSANTISGVSSDLRYPDDTLVSNPTMTVINGNAYKTSYTVAASPAQTGKHFLYYYYTDGSTVYSSSNRGPFDSFTVRAAGQCGTTGTQDVNVSKVNSVATTSVTTINPNLGTTQPVNFTGTATTAYVKSDTIDVGGTAQTARDLGASVLLSSGTGTGQISLSSGAVLLQPTQTGVTIPTVTTLTNNVTVGTFSSITLDKSYCDITASTSGTSFTIAACTDAQGNSIAIAANKFVGNIFEAYTNGGTTCNVNGQSVSVIAMSAGGVITVQNVTPPNQAFTTAPNTTNCGVIIK